MLAAHAIDLVLLDIMMPGEDGLSLAGFIRATSAIPVILLTAKAEETDRIVGLEIGADDYVTKPFCPRELLARIKAVLRRTAGERRAVHAPDADGLRLRPLGAARPASASWSTREGVAVAAVDRRI